ncbi:MAG: hypothetical protein II046_00700 [Clostridiales bacterium]|nr:hypothetical protein [Clostridiales bacterium]MBQ5473489.1 hypothetical protein [Lachnospiraceae bacterium]
MKKLAIIVSMITLVVLMCALPAAAGSYKNSIYGKYGALSHKETGKITHPMYDNNKVQSMKYGTACIAAEVFYENGKTANYKEIKVQINDDYPITVSAANANSAVGYHIGYLKNFDGKTINSSKGFDW